MHKKSVIIPIIAVFVIIAGVFASSGLFPDTGSLPRIPKDPGTIGGVLFSFFEADGTAKNTNTLSGVSSTGYLQNNNCTDPINNKWTGVDANGRGICGNGGTTLAAIGKFSEISGTVEVLKYGTSIWVPANTSDSLYPGDFIRTNSSGTGTIKFTMDDSLIRLFTDTTLELQMGTLNGNTVAEAILSDGRLWGRILSSTGVNLGGGGVVTGVRGTSVDVRKVANLYTISVTDSVNPFNTLNWLNGTTISAVQYNGVPVANSAFGSGTRFTYLSGAINNITKTTDDKNNFYSDIWFRHNTRLDVRQMSDLLNSYLSNPDPVTSPKKNRLVAELNTTIEANNTGTLTRLLQDYPAIGANLANVVNMLDEENRSSPESPDVLNIRKAKRFECKAKGQTYFPGLDENYGRQCSGSWDTLAITDFDTSTGKIFGKNSNWNLAISGALYDDGNIGKITNTGQYMTFKGSSNSLAGKKIHIILDHPVGSSAPVGTDKFYILDGGLGNRYYVTKKKTCTGAGSADSFLCAGSTQMGLYTGSTNFTFNIGLNPSYLTIGNSTGGIPLSYPIGTEISQIYID